MLVAENILNLYKQSKNMHVHVCHCFTIEYVLLLYLINIAGMHKWIVLTTNPTSLSLHNCYTD